MEAGCNALLRVLVAKVNQEAQNISSFVLKGADGPLPDFTAGSHIDVHLPSGLVRQYSLIRKADSDSYHIAVLRDHLGRGGSIDLHDNARLGSILHVSKPRNNFPLASVAKKHVLIAGGIGITPILSMIYSLIDRGERWHLHYGVRDETSGAFLNLLATAPFSDYTTIHIQDMAVEELERSAREEGTHVYCCGPTGLMKRVENAFHSWPEGTVHFESFVAAAIKDDDRAFDVEIASTGEVITVEAGESLLDALTRHGLELPSLCTQGVCGTCVVDLVEGEADHRDSVLFESERSKKIVTCCSRAISQRLKIGL